MSRKRKIILYDGLDELLTRAFGLTIEGTYTDTLLLDSGLLHMAGWRMTDVKEDETSYLVEAEYPLNDTQACTHCGVIGQYVRFGSRKQQYHDLPSHDKQVRINVQRPRLRCKACGKVFQQQLPFMDMEHFMTERLVIYIRKESMRKTFTSIAEAIGVDEKTVRLIFNHSPQSRRAFRRGQPFYSGTFQHLWRQFDG